MGKLTITCPACGSRYRVDESHAGKKACCKKCSTLFAIRRPTERPLPVGPQGRQQTDRNVGPHPDPSLTYEKVPGPSGDGACSDRACPCPGTRIPRGTGYLYISEGWLLRKEGRSRPLAGQEDLGPILMCEQGARRRNLDLAVAAADARHWWKTGLAPLRGTPRSASATAGPGPKARARAGAADRCVKCGNQIKQWGFQADSLAQMMHLSMQSRDAEVEEVGRSIGKKCPGCGSVVCSMCYQEEYRCPRCGKSIEF